MTPAATSVQTTPSSPSELTTAQRLLWLGQKLTPASPLYNMAFLFTLGGEVNETYFQTAFQAVVDRSDSLRTVIDEVDGSAIARVLSQLDYAVPVLDFREKENAEVAVRSWAKDRTRRLFDLSSCLFDTALIRLPTGQTIWYLNQHHLITDISTVQLLFTTVSDFYQRAVSGTITATPNLPAYTALRLPTPSSQAIDYWRSWGEAQPVALYHRSAAQASA